MNRNRENKVAVGQHVNEDGTRVLTIYIGRNVPDTTTKRLADWASRHGAEPCQAYYVGTLESARGLVDRQRGYRSRGDLDAYANRTSRRAQVAQKQFQSGWRLKNPLPQAISDARMIARNW